MALYAPCLHLETLTKNQNLRFVGSGTVFTKSELKPSLRAIFKRKHPQLYRSPALADLIPSCPRSSRPKRIVLGVFGVRHGTCTHQAHTGTRVNFAVSQKIEFRQILKFLSLPATFTKHMLRMNFAFRGSI